MRASTFAIVASLLAGTSSLNAQSFSDQAADQRAAAPAHVIDQDSPIRRMYQQTASTNSCTSAGDCVLNFPAITNTHVLLQHASCFFALANSGSPFISYSRVTNQAVIGSNFFVATKTDGDNGNGFINWSINSDAYLFYAKHDVPRIDVYSVGQPVHGLSCTLTGYYED